MNANELGAALRQRRIKLCLTATTAAGLLGKSTQHVLNIETKTASTRIESIIEYMKLLGMHLDVKQTM